MAIIITPKKNLYNAGLCFTQDKAYRINRNIQTEASLMDIKVKNDMGQDHIIGSWWRDFTIVDDFTNDEEKMEDFYILSKEQFLATYSYLTDAEYEATQLVMSWDRGY